MSFPSRHEKTNSFPSDHQRPRIAATSGGGSGSGRHGSIGGWPLLDRRRHELERDLTGIGARVPAFVSTAAPVYVARLT